MVNEESATPISGEKMQELSSDAPPRQVQQFNQHSNYASGSDRPARSGGVAGFDRPSGSGQSFSRPEQNYSAPAFGPGTKPGSNSGTVQPLGEVLPGGIVLPNGQVLNPPGTGKKKNKNKRGPRSEGEGYSNPPPANTS